MKKFLLALLLPFYLMGFNDAPSCLYDLQVNFFPPDISRQSFDMFYVFQSQWDPILTSLKYEAGQVPRIMRERARALKPNPIDYPFDADKTKELLLAVEYEVFRTVLVRNYVYDLQAIRGMFDNIVLHQQKRIDACLVKKKVTRPSAKKM